MVIDSQQLSSSITLLLDCVMSSWKPVDELIKLGGVTLLMQIVTLATEWNYAPKSASIRFFERCK